MRNFAEYMGVFGSRTFQKRISHTSFLAIHMWLRYNKQTTCNAEPMKHHIQRNEELLTAEIDEIDYLLSYNADTKNKWSFISTPLHNCESWCTSTEAALFKHTYYTALPTVISIVDVDDVLEVSFMPSSGDCGLVVTFRFQRLPVSIQTVTSNFEINIIKTRL